MLYVVQLPVFGCWMKERIFTGEAILLYNLLPLNVCLLAIKLEQIRLRKRAEVIRW